MERHTLQTGLALHARPLDRLVRAARSFSSRVTLRYGAKEVDGRDVMQLLLLGVPAGGELTLTVEGEDEAAAVPALLQILSGAAATEDAAPVRLSSLPGAPGTGVGLIRREGRPGAAPRERRSPEEEKRRLRDALCAAVRETEALARPDDPFCDIFGAQRMLLEDASLACNLSAAIDAGASVEAAIAAVFDQLEQRFTALGPGFASERHADVADVRDRLVAALAPLAQASAAAGEPFILVLREATPSRLALLDLGRVAGVISHRGGPSSHAAIVARGRGIPLVFSSEEELASFADGERVMVDGDLGAVLRLAPGAAAPSESRLEAVSSPSWGQGPAVTADGIRVRIRANLGAPGDLEAARQWGCDGCGVLRTEILFGDRGEAPSVDEQVSAYRRVALALAPHTTVIRLFDAGSDKPLPFLPGPKGEHNPALGQRGLRLLLQHPRVLRDQLTSIAEARRSSGCDLRALVPMVIDADELAALREMAAPDLPLGAMIETPAAALLVRSLCREAAFVSLGTNDLTQYVLAQDRLRDELGGAVLHPAVLRLVSQCAEEAARAGVECSVCGELAGDDQVAPLLVGLGVTTLSMSPGRIPIIRAALARCTRSELAELARRALAHDQPSQLSSLLLSLRSKRT